MRGQGQQRGIVDDRLALGLAQHRGLHALIEDLPRYPLQVLEGSHVTAQHRLQVLVQDEARPQIAAVAALRARNRPARSARPNHPRAGSAAAAAGCSIPGTPPSERARTAHTARAAAHAGDTRPVGRWLETPGDGLANGLFLSTPVRAAIADTDKPRRCNSRIITSPLSVITLASPRTVPARDHGRAGNKGRYQCLTPCP